MKPTKRGTHRYRVLALAAMAGVALGLSSCAIHRAPVVPPLGFIYTDVKAPLSVDFDHHPAGMGTKKASSSSTQYLYLYWVAFGWDANSIHDIARKGGIEEISYADYEFFSVLGIYRRLTVNVYGN